jgi:hypothetical protein
MKLSKRHMEAFTKRQEDKFLGEMVIHLAVSFPDQLAVQNLAIEDLADVLREGMGRAGEYGVTSEGDLERYFEFMAILGPEFDTRRRYRWAAEILKQEDIDADEKMDEISDHVIFALEEPPNE